MVPCFIAFFSAMFTDIIMVKYIKSVELNQASRGAVLSMMMAMFLLTGVNEALHDFRAACFWVLGYGAGSYIAIRNNAKTKNC